MPVVNLYNSIYRVLANDQDVLFYLGIDQIEDKAEALLARAEKIQKRAKPQDLIERLPLIAFYAPPGEIDRGNQEVYVTPVVFDVYTRDDVDRAQRISSRIVDLLHRKIIPVEGVDSFETRFLTAHESSTDLANTYCFTTVLEFSISIT